MKYKVILTKNGEHKKNFGSYKTKTSAFRKFRELRSENRGVMFPKKYVNYNGIVPVQYTLHIVKEKEEGEEGRYIRDEMGRIVQEEPLYGKYTILDKFEYHIEETFWIYGNDPKSRNTIHDIMEILMRGIYDKKFIKNVIVVHNKLLIYNEEMFEMVICKCKDDAQRLNRELANAAIKNKIKNIIFSGTATKKTVSDMYEIIHKKTKWPMSKIRRTTTRP